MGAFPLPVKLIEEAIIINIIHNGAQLRQKCGELDIEGVAID